LAGSVFLGVLIAACVWPSPERQFLIDFFQACRLYDTVILARLSTVSCNPKTDGIVEAFELVNVERDGDAARRVTIRARVRRWEGGVSNQAMTVGLERRDRRWMVTTLTPPPASQTSPAASSVPPN
jgi:hypothetical protein